MIVKGGCGLFFFEMVKGRMDRMCVGVGLLCGLVMVECPYMSLTRDQFVLHLAPGVTSMDMLGLACDRMCSRDVSVWIGGGGDVCGGIVCVCAWGMREYDVGL